jgi:hypothetical protein
MYDWAQFQKCSTSKYELLLQCQQNRSKAMMWLLYKNSGYSRVPKALLHWQLCVACYYPYRLPQHYKSIAVNIEFCGYLWFLSITFVWIIWVQYATDNISGQEKVLLHRPVLIFQPTVNSRASNNHSKQWQNLISQLGKMHSYKVSTYISVFVEVFRRWRRYILAPKKKAWPSSALQHSKPQQLTK